MLSEQDHEGGDGRENATCAMGHITEEDFSTESWLSLIPSFSCLLYTGTKTTYMTMSSSILENVKSYCVVCLCVSTRLLIWPLNSDKISFPLCVFLLVKTLDDIIQCSYYKRNTAEPILHKSFNQRKKNMSQNQQHITPHGRKNSKLFSDVDFQTQNYDNSWRKYCVLCQFTILHTGSLIVWVTIKKKLIIDFYNGWCQSQDIFSNFSIITNTKISIKNLESQCSHNSWKGYEIISRNVTILGKTTRSWNSPWTEAIDLTGFFYYETPHYQRNMTIIKHIKKGRIETMSLFNHLFESLHLNKINIWIMSVDWRWSSTSKQLCEWEQMSNWHSCWRAGAGGRWCYNGLRQARTIMHWVILTITSAN